MDKIKMAARITASLLTLMLIFANGMLIIESFSAEAASSTVTTTATGIGNAVSITYPVEVSVGSELTLTCDTATSTMLQNISGISGGVATSSRGCSVKTNNMSGWTMTAKASSSPAMVSVSSSTISFADAATGVPAAWSAPAANASKFGFNVTGTYADASFSGSKYTGFNGTSPITIGSNSAPTDASGEFIYINYKAEVGSAASQPTGLYRSWTTVTAYMN